MTRATGTPARRRLLRRPDGPRLPHPRVDHAAPVDDDALRELAAENRTLLRELARVQERSSAWRDECLARTERLDAALVRARGDGIAKETRIAALRDELASLRRRAATWLTNEELLRRLADLRARNRSLEGELARTRAEGAPAPVAPPGRVAAEGGFRSVLCLGIRARHVADFRAWVEARGGRFAHAAGLVGEPLDQLAPLLAEADLVVIQAGYVCSDARRAAEQHCAHTGKRCVLLDKPCAQAFVEGLARLDPGRASVAGD